MIRQLDEGRYQPIYSIDRDESQLWEIWIDGFQQAMCLRPEAWTSIIENQDPDIQRALFVLGRLGDLATSPGGVESMEIDEELKNFAADLIPPHVEILHRARLAQANPFAPAALKKLWKVGRNDPCPCGSGRKYKKCCLNRP